MELPSTQLINDQRIVKFKQRISESLEASDLPIYYKMVEQFQQESDAPPLQIAAALALLLQGDTPFLLQNKPHKKSKENWDKDSGSDRGRFREKFDRDKRGRERSGRERDRPSRKDRERSPERASRKDEPPGKDMARYRIEVGHDHEVKPGNIMGAIANEAGLDSQNIGRIAIHDNYSLVDLPDGMPKEIFNDLKKVWVSGQQLKISRSTNERSGSRNSDTAEFTADNKGKGKPEKKDKEKGTIKLSDKAKAKKKKRKNKDKGKPKKKDPK
jgi:ATP-dependent RNA helicase DeaD